MRSLKPINEQGALLQSTSEKPITNAQYEELVEKTQEAVDCANAASQATSDLATSLQSNVNTSNITADNIRVETAEVDALCSDAAWTTTMDGPYVQWDCNGLSSNVNIGAPEISADAAHIVNVDADTVAANTICAECLNVDNFNPTNLSVTCADATRLDATCAVVCDADIRCETVFNSEIQTACVYDLNSDTASIDLANLNCANIADGKATKIDIAFITHTQTPQVIDSPIDQNGYYIVTPAGFKNGHLDIIGMIDDTTVAYVIRVQATEGNFVVQWTKNNAAYLDTFYFDNTGNQLAIKASGANRIYKQMSSFDCTSPLQIYSLNEYSPAYSETMDVTDEFRGTYIPWVLTTNRFKAEDIEIESVDFENINVSDSISLPASKDQYGQVDAFTEGQPGQYVTNVIDEYNSKYPKWVNPAASVTECDTSLISSDAVYNYDGTATDCDGCTAYPIKNLGNETVAHGDFAAPNFAAIDADTTAQSLDDIPDGSLVTIKDTVDGNDIVRKGTRDATTVADPAMFATSGCFTSNGQVAAYNCDTNSFEPIDDVSFNDGSFTGNVNIGGDTVIGGDLYVAGTMHIDDTEVIESTADMITLRANNSSPLANGEQSGLLINNYNSNGDSLALVSDNTGTLRVGTGTGTQTTYANLYYVTDTNKYYTDAEYTTEVTPQGALKSWASVELTDDGKHWTDAVFETLDYTTQKSTWYIDAGTAYYAEVTGIGYLYPSRITPLSTVPAGTKDTSIVSEVTSFNFVAHESGLYITNNGGSKVYNAYINTYDGGKYIVRQGSEIEGAAAAEILANGTFTGLKNASVVKYDTVVSTLVPLLARNETADMTDNALIKWDNANEKAVTIPAPNSEAYLKYDAENGYSWETPQAGVFHYATEAVYLADAANVPIGSAVVIDEYDNFVYGENE